MYWSSAHASLLVGDWSQILLLAYCVWTALCYCASVVANLNGVCTGALLEMPIFSEDPLLLHHRPGYNQGPWRLLVGGTLKYAQLLFRLGGQHSKGLCQKIAVLGMPQVSEHQNQPFFGIVAIQPSAGIPCGVKSIDNGCQFVRLSGILDSLPVQGTWSPKEAWLSNILLRFRKIHYILYQNTQIVSKRYKFTSPFAKSYAK